MKKFFLWTLLSVAGWGLLGDTNTFTVATVSPDGRNEIRLETEPLSYEVLRDGVIVVAKSAIGMRVDGETLAPKRQNCHFPVLTRKVDGTIATPVYKKAKVDLTGNETFVDFGPWGVRLAARNDGVAYRFETKLPGKVRIDEESAQVVVPDGKAQACVYRTENRGWEEAAPTLGPIGDVQTDAKREFVYLPLVYTVSGKTVAVTDADVRDYPAWYLTRRGEVSDVVFEASFAPWPKTTYRSAGGGPEKALKTGGRWVRVGESENWLVETDGTRNFPWRAFVLCDEPSKLCEADLVFALSAPQAKMDFSWVRPGKVAWDWWNAFDNIGEPEGCTTRTYERFIDFAAKSGVEYVILDEGWSEKLNIWKYHPNVDVPYLIDYANRRGVGIILWMAWAQAVGDEERVVEHFAKLGAKGFKVDFMDRGDAEAERFLWKFADACARRQMLVDYHGAHRPTGLSRAYPNVLNYEGIHGLEQMKWYRGDYDILASDVAAFFGRLTAGPMDYTPGAMDNYPIGGYPKIKSEEVWKDQVYINPGSLGTRCRQIAMMVAYEAPLQMLCDSPTKYERSMECFSFMAKIPTVWDETVGLGGTPDTFAAVARRKGDVWYVAALASASGRDFEFRTDFLREGDWRAEIFCDAVDSDCKPTHYVHKTETFAVGERHGVHMARGGGFCARIEVDKRDGRVRAY